MKKLLFTLILLVCFSVSGQITNSGTWIIYLLGFQPATNTVNPRFQTLELTNGLFFATNYYATNFIPIPGYIRVSPSNNVIYAVSETKTNVWVNNEP